jgi:hypothetical protein
MTATVCGCSLRRKRAMVFGSSQRNASRPVSSVGIDRLLRIHSAFFSIEGLDQQFFDVLCPTCDHAFNTACQAEKFVEHLFDGRRVHLTHV